MQGLSTHPKASAAQVLQAEYNRRVGIERAQHDLVCQPIRQRNAERHEAAGSRREQRKLTEKANDELVLAAEQLHHQRLYEVHPALAPLYALLNAMHVYTSILCSYVTNIQYIHTMLTQLVHAVIVLLCYYLDDVFFITSDVYTVASFQ